MKKKLTALLLALLLVGSLTSCGGSSATSAADTVDETATTEEEVTYTGEPEVDDSTPDADDADGTVTPAENTTTFDEKAALAYFETSEGQERLYQYLFGGEETTEEPADDSTGGNSDSTEGSSSGFDDLSTEKKAEQIIEYLKLDTVNLLATIDRTAVEITEGTTLDSFDFDRTFSEKTDAEIVAELETREFFDDAAWVALYENGFTEDQKTDFRAWYTANNTDPGSGETEEGSASAATSSAESEPLTDGETATATEEDSTNTNETEDVASEDEEETDSSTGYDAWLRAMLKDNADDRSMVWNDLNNEEILRNYLESEEGQAFLGSNEVQQLLAEYYTENPDAMAELAINTGYRGKLIKNFVIVLVIVVVVLLAVFAAVLLLLLSRAGKREDKLRRELREAKNQQNAVPTRPDGGMDLELKQKLTSSPSRKVSAPTPPPKPVTPPTPVTPPKPVTPPAPPEQKGFFTQPPAPVAPVVAGYYKLSQEAVDAARYYLPPQFSVQKVSDQPTNPPTPYVGYSDQTLDLNRDYYTRTGGNKANNARAWDSLMGATVQITECFDIVTQDGVPITDVSGAAGKQLVSVKRAKMGADGSITARGTITLA